MTFVATHTVGGGGAATWAVPDPTAPDGPRLDPWLAVQVLEYKGDWAHIRCDNGWEAWTDGRSLLAAGAAGPPAGSPQVASGYAPQPSAEPASGYVAQPSAEPASGYVPQTAAQPVYTQPAQSPGYQVPPPAVAGSTAAAAKVQNQVKLLGAGGAALAVVSAWIPYQSVGGFSLKIWDLKLMALIADDFTKTSGPWAGLVVVCAALGFVALMDGAPWWLLEVAALCALVPALLFLIRYFGADAAEGLSVGPFATIAGGGALAYAGWLAMKPAR